MLAPGPLLLIAYQTLRDHNYADPLLIYANKKDVATMIAGFAYTMLGFMATVVTILFAFNKSANFESYRRKKYLGIFFGGYYLCIACLILTAFLSLSGYSSAPFVKTYKLMLISFANNLWQIFLLTVVICNIARHSIDNPPQ